MALATTAALAAAGVSALGGLAGGIMSNRANNKATRASTQAGENALAFAREQETTRQRERAEQMAMDKAQWDARESRRAEILGRYGRRYQAKPYAGVTAPQASTGQTGAPRTLGSMFSNSSPAPLRRQTSLGGMYGA